MAIFNVSVEAAPKVRKTKITKVTAKSYNKVKVTWKKIKDANGYVIYRKAGSGKWKKVKTIKGNMTYYYDTKVKSNTTYRYRVKVYKKFKKKKYSKFSNVHLVTTPKLKTNITDLQIVDISNFDIGKTTIKDAYGNLYMKYFDTSCWSENQYVNLYLAENYNVLNLTIAPHEETFSSMEAYIYIYADDELIYSSKSITKITKPIQLNLDVKNVDVLKILQTENEWNCRGLIISGNAVE